MKYMFKLHLAYSTHLKFYTSTSCLTHKIRMHHYMITSTSSLLSCCTCASGIQNYYVDKLFRIGYGLCSHLLVESRIVMARNLKVQ
jgi:hypothetical protein